MNLWSLISREIRYRKTGFIIGLVCVTAAIASLVGSVTLFDAYDRRTDEILIEREQETKEEMDRLERDYRIMMRDMGHNVMILSDQQSLHAMRTRGYPDTTMPEEYVHMLSEGHVETLNHLLPVLEQRITWPEQDIDIVLFGTPGQIPIYHQARFLTDEGEYRNPIVEPMPRDAVRVGAAVAREIGLRPGDTVTMMDEEMRVEEIKRPEGDHRDLRVWVHLDKAQEWLDKEDKINVIWALECICDIDALGKIEEEIHKIIPDVHVEEMSSMVIARGQARQRAEEEAKRSIAAAIEHRTQMGEAQRAFAAVLVPLVMIASGLWVFFLILSNVRERESEIGILRAIGVKEAKIMAVFLGKAIIIGLIGAVAGYFTGVISGVSLAALWEGALPFTGTIKTMEMFSPAMFAGSVIIAVALCAVAGWIPALQAAGKDPADVLRDE